MKHKSHGGMKSHHSGHHYDGHHTEHDKHAGMQDAGHRQGDMSPHVEDYQRPHGAFAEEGFSRTTDYIARMDKHQEKQAHDVKKQAYMGRYS